MSREIVFGNTLSLRVHDGDADQAVDPLVASAEAGEASAWRGSAYAVFEGLQLADYGNRIPSLSFEVVADDAPVALGSMLGEQGENIASEAGPTVTGFAATGGSLRAVVEAIRPAFALYCRDEGRATVRFGAVAGPSFEPRDLGTSATGTRVARISRDIAPRDATAVTLSVAYRDPARDYQAGLQRARREGPGLRDERIDLPATLSADAAFGIATNALSRRAVERRRAAISLPWRALSLRPGDAMTIDGEAWRIAETRFERMTVQADLVRADTLPSAATHVVPGRNVAQLDAVHGATTLTVVDLPALSDTASAAPVVGVFAAGVSPGWRRAALMASIDGGASFVPMGTTALPAIIGATITPLAAGSPHIVDRINSVDVDLLNTAMLLVDADEVALLAGANRAMIGAEMLQFGRATPIAPRRWRLSALWRGRGGTDDAIAAHPAGAGFVLLEDATLTMIPSAQAIAGVQIMAAGIGDSDPFPQATCPTAARAVTPLSPVHPVVTGLSSGDRSIVWTRRSRAGWAWRDGIDAPLGEEREAYSVTWAGGSIEVPSPNFVYTAAMRAADLSTGASQAVFSIRQLGDLSVSAPLLVTIDLN